MRVVFGADRPGSTPGRETGVGTDEGPRANPRASPGALDRPRAAPNVAADPPARTAGLCSPPAPPEGALAPTESGWLIWTGAAREQLYPVFSRRAERAILAASFYVCMVGMTGLPTGALAGGLILGLPLLAVMAGVEIVPRARVRRQLALAERVVCLADAPSGTLVRVTGTIAPQATVPTLFRGVPAVLFRNRIAAADETRGQDFLLDLDGGEQAKVAARRAFLLDPGERTHVPPACGPVSAHQVDGRSALRSDLVVPGRWLRPWRRRYESSVGPGDRVEVCGVIEHVLDPTVGSLSRRAPPIRPVLMAGEEIPLLVRRA